MSMSHFARRPAGASDGLSDLCEHLEPRRLLAATYYVDAQAPAGGNGSSSSPWNSIAQVNAAALAAGDSVLFQKGDTFRGSINVSASGSAPLPITFGAYGSASAKPIIRGSERLTGFTAHATLANVWQLSVATRPYMVTIDGQYVKYRGTTDPSTIGDNEFSWVSGVLYIKRSAGDPDNDITEVAQRNHGLSGSGRDYITVQDLRIENTSSAGILVQNGSTNWTIQRCEVYFTNSATADGAGVHLNGAHDTKILNSTFHRTLGDAILGWKSQRVEVSGNHITEVNKGFDIGGDGIQFSGSSTGRTDGFIITNNYVDLRGTDVVKGCIQTEYGDGGYIAGNTVLGGKYGIELNSDGGTVEYNTVGQPGTNGGIRVAQDLAYDDITIRYNLVYSGAASGIYITNDTTNDANTPRTNLNIHNNTVRQCYSGILITTPVSGVLRNNIVWNTSTTRNPQYQFGTIATGGTWTSDYNLFGQERPGSRVLVRVSGVDYYTLADYQAATGRDSHSLAADPLFVDVTTHDYRLQSTSPAINAGTNLGATTDLDGTSVPQNGTTDMGAYEYVSPVQTWVHEGFDYSAGTSVSGASGGTGFSGSWSLNAAGGTADVLSGSLAYGTLATTGNRLRIFDSSDGTSQTASRNLSQTFGGSDGSVWLAFMAQKFSSYREGSISFGGVKFRAAGGNWEVKTPNTSYAATAAGYSSLHLFVARIDFTSGTDTVRVWVDPNLTSTPSDASAALTINDTTGFTFSNITIAHGPFGSSSQRSEWDEIRIGNAFSAVAPDASTLTMMSTSEPTLTSRSNSTPDFSLQPLVLEDEEDPLLV
jgi:hypothetical protein